MAETQEAPSNEATPEVPAEITAAEQKFDAAQQAANPEAARPEWLPEKFNSAEDLAKAYTELETKLHTTATAPEIPDAPAHAEGVEPSRSPLSSEHIDRYTTEFVEKGSLSADSLREIEAMGIPTAMAEQHVRGLAAIQSQMQNEVYNLAGGEERYRAMLTWAQESGLFSEAQQNAYNAAIDSGNQAQISLALSGLKAAYEKDNPDEPKLLQADGGKVSEAGYASKYEMMADMRNPLYHKDPNFRKKVDEKLMRSPNL